MTTSTGFPVSDSIDIAAFGIDITSDILYVPVRTITLRGAEDAAAAETPAALWKVIVKATRRTVK